MLHEPVTIDQPLTIYQPRKEVINEFLPQIEGENTVRDLQLLCLYADDPTLTHPRASQIMKTHGIELSEERCRQIFKRHEHLAYKLTVRINKLCTVEGRADELIRILKTRGASRKDVIEILEQIRKELVGDRPQVETSVINVINFGSKGGHSTDAGIHRPAASGATGNPEAV